MNWRFFLLPTLLLLSRTEGRRVVDEILPSKEESAWLEIDWKTDLWSAREEAARTGKPIYLWEMDGHPLGCV